MRLRHGALMDNLRDFCDQVSLNQHIFAVGIPQDGTYASGVFFDRICCRMETCPLRPQEHGSP
jgi:hypothetical protein